MDGSVPFRAFVYGRTLSQVVVMMSRMSSDSHFRIECDTCVATGTTACAECIVTHLLANDDGPVAFVPVASPDSSLDRAIRLFRHAGLLDDPIEFVEPAEFERLDVSSVPAPVVSS
jgi:hypothetical protein